MMRTIKSLKLAAAVTAVFGLMSMASATGFDSSGSMRWRGEEMSDTLTTGAFNSRSTDTMAIGIDWDLKFMPDPKVSVFFQPKFVRNLGDDPNGSKGVSTSGLGVSDSGLDVHQAYMTFVQSDRMNLTLGRFEVNFGDEYVLGSAKWNFTGRALDGIQMGYKWSQGGAHILYSKLMDKDAGHATPGVDGDDYDLYGIYHSMPLSDIFSAFDLYYLVLSNRSTQTTPGPTSLVNTTGVRLKGGKNAVDYGFEYNTQSGESNLGTAKTDLEDAGSMRLDVGYTMNQNWRVGLEYLTSDRNYNQVLPTGHKFLGHMDLFSNRNITDTAVHVFGKFMDYMSLKGAYHMFARTNDDSAGNPAAFTSVYDFGGAAYGAALTGMDTDVGTELDIAVTCSKIKAMAWTLGYSQFSAGDYFTSTTKGLGVTDQMGKKLSSITYLYLQATATF